MYCLKMKKDKKSETEEILGRLASGEKVSKDDFAKYLESIKDIKYEINIEKGDDEMGDNEVVNLRHEIEKTNLKIDNTNKIISIVGGVIGVLITVMIFAINAQFSAINTKFDAIETSLNAINRRFDYQEKLNELQIQRDVSQEILKQKK